MPATWQSPSRDSRWSSSGAPPATSGDPPGRRTVASATTATVSGCERGRGGRGVAVWVSYWPYCFTFAENFDHHCPWVSILKYKAFSFLFSEVFDHHCPVVSATLCHTQHPPTLWKKKRERREFMWFVVWKSYHALPSLLLPSPPLPSLLLPSPA